MPPKVKPTQGASSRFGQKNLLSGHTGLTSGEIYTYLYSNRLLLTFSNTVIPELQLAG